MKICNVLTQVWAQIHKILSAGDHGFQARNYANKCCAAVHRLRELRFQPPMGKQREHNQ